uniref:U1-type domain-containing protein n=1 Tax=Paramormyrops kingsleyae TaxID=1676925 RepID=A0A3B3QBY7_9TELE
MYYTKLFCTLCNIVVEHRQKSSLDRHFSTAKHARRMAEKRGTQTRQITMTEAVACSSVASAERNKICEDWVSTCIAVNIPLSQSDHPAMRRFLRENVINGGAIPGFHQLQEKYLGTVFQKEKEALKSHLIDCEQEEDMGNI